MAFSSHYAGRAAMSLLTARRLVSSLAPSCDTIGGEEGECDAVAACLVSPRACLPLIVSRHLSDTDGGGGLLSIGSAGGLLALPRCIRAVSSLSSRIPAASSHGSFD